jgi:hypothetical protein
VAELHGTGAGTVLIEFSPKDEFRTLTGIAEQNFTELRKSTRAHPRPEDTMQEIDLGFSLCGDAPGVRREEDRPC